MDNKHYRVVIANSGKQDVIAIKKYILDNFMYRELAENFSKKIKKAIKNLDTFPQGYQSSGFEYNGYNIYLKSYKTYLIFYIVNEEQRIITILRVLQDGMNWKYIIHKWL